MILKNGYVWNGKIFEKKNLYIENGKFENISNSGPVLDATGLFAMPGFVDSHAHVIGTGMKIMTHDLLKEDLYSIISNSQEEFVIARGWEELPANALLNLANDFQKPVILIRKCGHVAWINNYLKDRLKKYENLLYESEIEQVWTMLGDEFYKQAFEEGQKEFIKHGVTQVHSDDFHGVSFELLKELLSHSITRIFEKLYTCEPWKYEFKTFSISKIAGIKLFADGSLGGKTAYMLKPYGDSMDFGKFTLPDNFDEIVRFAEKSNIQVNVHTIGDRALREVLNRFERNKVRLKHRLIHLQFASEEDFQRLKSYYLSVQPHFFFEDISLLENVSFQKAYPFLEMHKAGYELAFSTDSPVSPADPKYVLEMALKMGFTKADAIHYYTEAGSKIAGFACGRIDVGYRADFALYEKDPFESDPVAVFVDGKEVMSR